MHRLLLARVFLLCFGVACSYCPSQCTCVYHGRSDGSGTRSVLCNDPDMSDIPVNVPVDTVKLRIEKTATRKIPTEAFYYLGELRYLWITYNSISSVDVGSFYNLKVLHELRLDGNIISTFPWESLREMPLLRTLDLHNNKISQIPLEAIPYLVNITYLDVSSNKLTTLPSELMDIWPPFNGMAVSSKIDQKIVLGLQDNPWVCDCRISKVIELSKMTDSPVVLMDQFLSCSAPENFAGVPFQRAELDQCVKPSVLTSATRITASLGSNVLLRCDATGYPTPTLFWVRSDGAPVNNTVVQESPGEGVQWSIISIHMVVEKDTGDYICKAKNVAGNAEAVITLSVGGSGVTTSNPLRPDQVTVRVPPAATSTLPPILTTTRAVTTPPPPVLRKDKVIPSNSQQKGSMKPASIQQNGDGRKLAADQSKKKDVSKSVTDLRTVEETGDSVVLLWTADGLPGDAPLTVVYSRYGEDDTKRTVETEAGSGKVLLEGLSSGLRYSVCLVAKGSPAGKDPCIEFYTLNNLDGQTKLLMIISGIACAVVLPLIVLLLYKILGLFCNRESTPLDAQELGKESYVKFETLTMKTATNNRPHEMWARRQTSESERMLLCSRSSIDSQLTYKSESCRSEYLC